MHVSRSGYYKWMKRADSDRKLKREQLIAIVKQVHNKHLTHGARWTAAYIRKEYGYEFSDNYMYKIFKNLNIHAENKHMTRYKPRKEKDKFPNLIFSTWDKVDRPRQVIVSDMTVLRSKGGQIEVTFYFDVFTKQILTYKTGAQRGDRTPYIQGLKDLICVFEKEGFPQKVYLHTDQGSVYASQEYNDIIKDNNIIRSMSRAGKPTDNPVNEALNGWIKDELYADFKFYECRHPWEMQQKLDEFVEFYNKKRPCYALDYLTPDEFCQLYQEGKLEKRDTFENREITSVPKFVLKRQAAAAAKAAAEAETSKKPEGQTAPENPNAEDDTLGQE